VTAKKTAIAGLCVLTISACATVPMGPSIAVMPPPNKPFNEFQQDDYFCRGEAANAVQGEVQAANNAQVGGAIFTTILGTALGAAIGGGHGAAIGAAAGAGAGTLWGVNAGQWQQMSIQQRYDVVYAQCMYSHGNVIPGYGRPRFAPPPGGYAPPSGYAPPPPPGGYPPPPPGQ
jgi:hypothetical protein